MPEETANKIRIPIRSCEITATIDISKEQGIQALYCGGVKEIATYLFSKSKGWTMAKAKKWVAEHKKKAAFYEGSYGLYHEGVKAIAVSGREDIDNIPVQRFLKDMVSVGLYIHPEHKWELDVTPERLSQYLTAFKAMRANGVDVEIPIDHSRSAADNLGYVVDMLIKPNHKGELTIWGVHEIRGQNALDIIARNKNVSVAIEKNFVDGKGNKYGEAIVHSSVVQGPIVPGQNDFVKIAASRDGGDAKQYPVFCLFKGEKTMDKEMLLKLKALLGKDDDSTEENVLSRLEAAIKVSGENKEALDTAQKEVKKLSGLVKAAEKKTAGNTEVKIDPNLAEQMGSTAEDQLSLLVSAGKITPAVKDKLAAGLIGETGKRNLIALSLGENSSPSVLSVVVDALKENDLVKLGEQTGAQVMQRTVPADDKGEGTKADKESGDVMMSAAGVAKKKE